MLSWIVLIMILLYLTLIGEFVVAFWRIPDYNRRKQSKHKKFTLLIPFRNEETHLPKLLNSINELSYPFDHYEIILIDDNSTDHSEQLIRDFMDKHPEISIFCLDNIRQTNSPKKDALQLGIEKAQYDWIIATDADCRFSKNWLQILSSFIQDRKPKMVVGPVAIEKTDTVYFHNAFEQLDFLSLMGATIGGFGMKMPFLCNGAHLAYEKKAFEEVQGFTSNSHIASGDDHFLLEKFNKAYPKKVAYLKSFEAIVRTSAQKNWKSLLSQRIRWASKTSAYTYWFSKIVGMLVLMANLVTAILIVFIPVSIVMGIAFAVDQAYTTQLLILSLFLKWIADYLLIARTARFFERTSYLKWYPLMMLCYPFITLYIGVKALFSPYEWKGRTFKK